MRQERSCHIPLGIGEGARSGAGSMPEYENSEGSSPDSLIPFLPAAAPRSRIYPGSFSGSWIDCAVERTSERMAVQRGREKERNKGKGRKREREILAAAVSESAIPVSPLYRRPPPERNSDRAWLSFRITANRSRRPTRAALGIHKGVAWVKGGEIVTRLRSSRFRISSSGLRARIRWKTTTRDFAWAFFYPRDDSGIFARHGFLPREFIRTHRPV